MFKRQIFVLFLICICGLSYSSDEIFDIGNEVWKMYGIIEDIKTNGGNPMEVSEAFSAHNKQYRELVNQIHEIDRRFDMIEESMNLKSEMVRASLEFLIFNVTLHAEIFKLDILVARIDRIYEEFRLYLEKGRHVASTMDNIALQVTVELEARITLIRSYFIAKFSHRETNVLFQVIHHAIDHHSSVCGSTQTISYALYHIYRMVMIAEMKAYIVSGYAYTYLYYKKNALRFSNPMTSDGFSKQFGDYVMAFSLALDTADPLYLRACDPENGTWVRVRDFYELEETFQVTIFDYNFSKCPYYSCNHIWSEKLEECPPLFHSYRTSCAGTSAQCAYLGAIEACVLKRGPHKFEYVQSAEMGLLGKNSTCSEDEGYIIRDGVGRNSGSAACACNCYKNHNKISLSIMKSTDKFNMVITGLRFHYENNILYIQPREGRLGANGHISQLSQRWISIPDNAQESETRSIDKENRIFFLDDVHLPPEYALTGVKFTEVTRGTITGFAIEIFGVPCDYRSGELSWKDRMSKMASNGNTEGLEFGKISSIYTTLSHVPSPASIGYVELDRSELQDDFGQSTLPFFDAVEVITKPPSVLGGIGFFHKGVTGYAGFFSLRLYAFKYGKILIDFDIMHVKNGKVIFNNTSYD